MRDVAEQSIGWLVLAGIVLAVILAKRRHENKFSAAVSAARAEGHAEAVAALNAQQHVSVAVDASNRAASEHRCLDPFTCSVCSPALLAVVRAYRGVGAAGVAGALTGGNNDDNNLDHDDDSRADDYGRVVRGGRGFPGAILGDDSRRAEGDRHASDHARTGGDLAGLSGESLRPALVADMQRRPWAYDEADPRFERGVPVANGRRGRGPGR